MTDEVGEDLEIRRKRLRYHSWHRGTKELDLVLGQFAERYLPDMSVEDLDRYEAIINENEHDIYAWLAGREAVPVEHDHHIMKMILNFKITP
ncbi:MAG: succinate dehydrogenase assembly factor 2 [Rhodospirillaceae bacterium]|nr:succinate dehydrogenase assembly factor 2 [Rhodospirillaceae bacterium]MBT5894906.1 succinate dehydrogenase assembly factor 2 [Rhodospirillaceae bacterium]MBT6428399.1 succinate dehydrogenase assembly factor 2 [Rhodospirillaceae bacterium]MBT7756544.1 succinate dehydrogenase assembly factor 2 [Rhodospirillaceae bacterium]